MMTIDPIRKLDNISLVRYNNDKVSFPIPDSFIEANQLQPKDELEVYRDRVNGRDALILIPKKAVESIPQLAEQEANV